jgi:cell cycle checkpoint protein
VSLYLDGETSKSDTHRFNPIAPTFLRAALQSLLKVHFSTTRTKRESPLKEVLDIIVESANGDIRSAIMGLQFACLVELPNDKRGKTKSLGGRGRAKVVLDAVTRREQSLALFHMMGKVLYNKSKHYYFSC